MQTAHDVIGILIATGRAPTPAEFGIDVAVAEQERARIDAMLNGLI